MLTRYLVRSWLADAEPTAAFSGLLDAERWAALQSVETRTTHVILDAKARWACLAVFTAGRSRPSEVASVGAILRREAELTP